MKNAMLALVLTLTFAPFALAQKAFVYYLPAVARSGGVNGSFFVSEVRVFNKGTATANVDAYLLPAGDRKSFTVAPNHAASYADVMISLFERHEGGAGAMRVESDQPLLVSSELQNVNSLCPNLGGTTGQYVPAVPRSAASTHQRLAHLTSDAGHRTNFGVVNTSNVEANLTIKLFDTDTGSVLGEGDLRVQPQGWVQLNQIVDQFFIFDPVPHGMIEVTSDMPVIAYLSVLDNTTNDAFTILGDPAEN
ncbi:MAG: hypothetical protein WB973_22655 [Thermoanaerobaculia bacterium]